MKHLGTRTLETKRLILRQAVEDDAPKMFKNWTSDPEVTRYVTWNAHSCVEDTQGYVKYLLNGYHSLDFYQWIIELKDSHEPVGNISIVNINEETDCVEAGYCLGRTWWHQGIITEALTEVMRFMFDDVKAMRVEARHDTRNPNSGKVMKKCGMTFEGILRRAGKNTSGICDMAVYARIKECG